MAPDMELGDHSRRMSPKRAAAAIAIALAVYALWSVYLVSPWWRATESKMWQEQVISAFGYSPVRALFPGEPVDSGIADLRPSAGTARVPTEARWFTARGDSNAELYRVGFFRFSDGMPAVNGDGLLQLFLPSVLASFRDHMRLDELRITDDRDITIGKLRARELFLDGPYDAGLFRRKIRGRLVVVLSGANMSVAMGAVPDAPAYERRLARFIESFRPAK
jgi:hypothetical protein